MEVQKDFKELLESFNARGVEYVIVGAHALAFHGVPRYTGDIDLFREWARVVCHGSFEASTERLYNCGIIFKRARGEGRITRMEGLSRWYERFGDALVAEQLLRVGMSRRDWKQTLLSDGWMIVRHPDWNECKRICLAAAADIEMFAQ